MIYPLEVVSTLSSSFQLQKTYYLLLKRVNDLDVEKYKKGDEYLKVIGMEKKNTDDFRLDKERISQEIGFFIARVILWCLGRSDIPPGSPYLNIIKLKSVHRLKLGLVIPILNLVVNSKSQLAIDQYTIFCIQTNVFFFL
jgi:hypothetical protein